ncbi:MAG TPA: tRNA 2-thiocytidine(32) synthetase TtcA, partial [Kofleriaceae bacterium]|nr:tRNA 2-thiocytidine(32) synthetase TtcA [Kofleriaceae bacterium]
MELLPADRLCRRPAEPRAAGGAAPDLLRAIVRKVGQTIADFPMIADGDRVMVCVSGGKDSYALLDVLVDLKKRAPVEFELVAVNVDQGWPGYRTDLIAAHLEAVGVPYRMVSDDFASI